jgi:hypothetical protein
VSRKWRKLLPLLLIGGMTTAVLLVVPQAAATSPATGEEVTMDDRNNLARLVAPLNPDTARLIHHENTSVERLPTPFLLKGLIFRVIHRGKHKPVGFTVGYARAENYTALLATNPAAFQNVALKAGVRLDTPPLRLSYAVTLLETTRRFDRAFNIVRDAQDLRIVPNASPEETARFAALKDKYRTLLKLPEARGEPPWSLPIFAIVDTDLCRFDITLHADGRFGLERTVLEEDVPFDSLP